MADNYEFRKALVAVDFNRDSEILYQAQVYDLTREDLEENLQFYYGGDTNQYEHLLERWDEDHA